MKRFVMTLCLAVLLAVVLAVPALAAEHTHCLCADGTLEEGCTDHSSLTFTEVSDAESLKTLIGAESEDPVNICLSGSFTLEQTVYISGARTVNLCLGDQTLTVTGSLQVLANSTLNITACGENGKLAAGEGSGGNILYGNKGAINLYGGSYDFSAVSGAAPIQLFDGDGVSSPYTSTFTMYGGDIVGAASAPRGGAIYANSGNVYIRGGSITGGHATLGGAVSVNKGLMEMSGGTITGCTATTSGSTTATGGGVNIQFNASGFTLSGDAKIYGNTVNGTPQDVYMGKKGLCLILDGWSGNGQNGALVLKCRDAVVGSAMAQAKSGSLQAADVANLRCDDTAFDLMLKNGKAVLAVHKHCLCVSGSLAAGCTDHEELTFTGVYDTASLKSAVAGSDPVNIFLADSFTLTEDISVSGKTVNLCLNNRTLTLNTKRLKTASGGTLNITACSASGKLCSAISQALTLSGGSTALYNGTVDASGVNGNVTGGAVYVNADASTFTLHGGTIKGATLSNRGGGVYVNKGSFEMHGGLITEGTASSGGGGVCVYTGSMEMTGGVITGCNDKTTAATKLGGGVCMLTNADSITISGTAKIYGNKSGNNTVDNDVYIGNSGKTAYYLIMGDWEGNGKDANGNANVMHLVHKATTIGGTVVSYTGDHENPAAMRPYFALSGYQLLADAEGMTRQSADAHIHCICNGKAVGLGGHICQDVLFTEVGTADAFNALFTLSDAYKLSGGSANVCLTGSFTLATTYKLQNSTVFNLCLNGQTLTMDGAKLLAETKSVLNVGDCGTAGKILAHDADTRQMLYANTKGGQVNLFNGIVDATAGNAKTSSGGAVYVTYTEAAGYNPASFNMYGGKIIGATAIPYGGAVCVNAGVFNMYGGEIQNGTATTTDTNGGSGGGNVYVGNGGIFNMGGGSISGGQCASAFGGNVCVLGQMEMTGGTITGGSAKVGGNVAVSSDNTANVGGAMTMSGGLITGGTATGRGNGVYLRNMSNDLTLSGSAKIYGNNTDTGDKTDVSIAKALTDGSYRAIQLDGWKGNGTNENGQANPKLVVDREGDFTQRFAVFAQGAAVDVWATGYFASKDDGYYVLLNDDNQLILVNTPGNVTLRSGSDVIASFSKLQDAVTAAQGSNNIVQLNQPVTEDVSVGGSLYLDLNGFDVTGKVTVSAGSLYLIDRATADYAVETDEEGNVTGGFGKITGGIEGTYAQIFNTPKASYGSNWKYLVLKDANGLHAHRIYLGVRDAVLYPRSASLKYKTVFYCDEVAAAAIGDYGIILSETNELSAGFGAPLAYAGENDNTRLTLLSKVLESDMELAEQIERSDRQITARAYIKLKEAETNVLESSPKTVSFKSVVTAVLHWSEEEGRHLTTAQKMAMVAMHDGYYDLIHPWCGDTEEQARAVQIHSDWKANIKCVCLGRYEGHEAHPTCSPQYFEPVYTAEEFASYFTDGNLDRDAHLRLAGDFALDSKYSTNGHTLNLWLDGHTLTLNGEGNLGVTNGGTLAITELEDGLGRIDADCSRAITVSSGSLYLYDGYVDASGVTGGLAGGAVQINGNASAFRMLDGTISGTEGETAMCGGEGGLVFVGAGNSFYMYGGTVTGGSSTGNGGNVHVKGVMHLLGGTVEDGKADGTGKGGGNIYITGSGSKLLMSGGTIQNGCADTLGGSNVGVGNLATFEMTGGTVTNEAVSEYVYGGICVRNNAKSFSLSGDAKVYGHGVDVYMNLSGTDSHYITLGQWNGNGGELPLCVNADAGVSRVATFASGITDAQKQTLLSSMTTNREGCQMMLTPEGDGIEIVAEHIHCLCGTHESVGDHTQEVSTQFVRVANKAQWAALFTNRVLNADTTVYLSNSLTLEGVYSTGVHTLNLCLNGNTITMANGRLQVTDNGELNITDCKDTGTILAQNDGYARIILVNSGKANLYGGTLDVSVVNLSTGSDGSYGGAVHVQNEDSSFTMYGGNIIGAELVDRGGAVYVNNGNFNMHGGTIRGGTAKLGGAVSVNKGSMVMTGGTITGCTAIGTDATGGGVNIQANATSFTISGTAQIYGNYCNDQPNDVYIGNNTSDYYYLQLGQWEGNGQDNGVNRVMNLSHRAVGMDVTVVKFVEDGLDGNAMKEWFALAGYDLAVSENALMMQYVSDHAHCICGNHESVGDHTEEVNTRFYRVATKEQWDALFSYKALKQDISIYLSTDLELDVAHTTGEHTLNLCLNGHTIEMNNGRLAATENGTLNISDCDGDGTILASSTDYARILLANNGHINLYGGTVDASAVTRELDDTVSGNCGGAVSVVIETVADESAPEEASVEEAAQGEAVFTMYSGKLIGAAQMARGGAVYVSQGNFYMHGGTIQGGTATLGGAVSVNIGAMEMTGGTITGGVATVSGGGVNIQSASAGFTISGTAKIYGNSCNGEANDVHIGNDGNADYFLKLGQWEGNGLDENNEPRMLNLSHKEERMSRVIVRFTEDGLDRYAMKKWFTVTEGYVLAVTADSLVMQPEGGHIHCLCNGTLVGVEGHICEDVLFLPANQESFVVDGDAGTASEAHLFESWTGNMNRLKGNTNIYLTEDVTLTERFGTSGKTLNICLCGKTLTMSGKNARIWVGRQSAQTPAPGTLGIADHSGGKILAGENCQSEFIYSSVGNINLYGGTVDTNGQNIRAITVNGGANAVDTFTMYGGTVIAGSTSGGGVYVSGGNMILNGGTVDASGKTGSYGPAVYVTTKTEDDGTVYPGRFTMNGGSVLGGTAQRGGAVYAYHSAVIVEGGTISGGEATDKGGNLCVANGTFDMSGGNITGGTAVSGGGNLFLTSATATLSGGSITDGKSTADGSDPDTQLGGGNLCLGFESALDISGGTVNGGTCAMGCGDISVQPTSITISLSGAPTVGKIMLIGKSLTLNGPLTGGSVGVQLKSGLGQFALFPEDTTASDAYFTSVDGHTITVDGNRLLLTEAGMLYKAAYASASVTPTREDVNAGLQLSGYGESSHRTSSESQLGELLATALAVTDAEGDTVVMISVDACNISDNAANKARRAISRRTGVPIDNIAISAIHQHSTPSISTVTDGDGNVVTDYAATFHNGVVDAALEALSGQEKVQSIATDTVQTMGQGDGGASFNYIRNIVLKDQSGSFVGTYTDNHHEVVKGSSQWDSLSKSYESNVDHTLQLTKLTLASGKPVILVNFQTHPHLSGTPESPDVHADFVGVFREKLGSLTGADVIYISGASGDVNPRDSHLGAASYEKLQHEAYGLKLAEVANRAAYGSASTNAEAWDVAVQLSTETLQIRDDLEGLEPADAESLIQTASLIRSGELSHSDQLHVYDVSDIRMRIYSVYHAKALMSRYEMLHPADGSSPGPEREVTISAFSLGPVAIVNAPYEMFQVNGQQIKGITVDGSGAVSKLPKTNGFDMVIVASKTNADLGYIPSLAGYTNGGYSTDVSKYTSGTGEALAACYQAMLTALSPAQ